MPNNDSTKNKITDYFITINEQLDAAHAICDAATVLVALERSLSHHDTQPSHNILIGGGYAHELKTKDETLTTLLKHATTLIGMSRIEVDRMSEATVEATGIYSLKEGGYAKH